MNLRTSFCSVWPALAGLGLAVSALAGSPALPTVPTPRIPVTNVYHGVQVVDPYRWLENGSAPAVHQWIREENARTAAYFARLPYRTGIAQELTELLGDQSARYSDLQEEGGRLFALRFKPPAQQPVLVWLSSLERPALWRVVFNPNTWNTNGMTAIDWFVPSPNGHLVAVSLSTGGSERGTLHFFNVDTGKPLPDQIPRVQIPTGGGSAAWTGDSAGVFYTRYPHPGERPAADLDFYQQVWFHGLGTPVSQDHYEIGRDFPRIAEIELESSRDGRWILAAVANGDGGQFAHYLRDAAGHWHQLTHFDDGVKQVKFGWDNALYLRSEHGAPRGKILRVPLAHPDLAHATVVVPERRGVIQDYAPAVDGLYVSWLLGGPSELGYFRRGSTHPRRIPILPISAVSGLKCWHDDELVFGNVSYLQPFAYYTYRPTDKRPRRTALHTTSPVDFSDMEVVRAFATSKDGTKIPLNIIEKKGTRLNGQNYTLLNGYGGFDISLTPSFNVTRRIWFDAGGILVIANLRGGGEYGEAWHRAGMLTHKQNVFDDFIAAAEYLIRHHYTNPSRLAVIGGSNGGLLMGAFLTQRPDLARAVVSEVGIYDMLRLELDPNGQFNVTEYGSVKNLAQFKALYAYSPYEHVRNGVKYPAVFLTTGENDGRVNPAHSRKMTARLQAATGSDHPILLRTYFGVGHGFGSSLEKRITEEADVDAFLFDQLGINAAPWEFK